ncbi:MAG: phosphoribosylaminoimidazolesuccinocarboxamide synthase, partial [Desulfobacterales bacterium]|nr:phosphoribosylaminoimidazolesuccinocarboxamide synthase [Desulfobacterales bacterium]
SRFWPKVSYRSGTSQESFDKQYVRDYLISIKWDKSPPPPSLPGDVIRDTRKKYLEALTQLTGISHAF